MAGKTITRIELCEAVMNELGLSRSESNELLQAVLEEISQTLIRGDKVKLSSFGTFQLRQKNQRIGRNPRTKEEAVITARRVLSFKASNLFKDKLNKSA